MVKIAFGSIGDSFSVTSIKSYVAEFIATLLFVFAGVGSAIAYSKLSYLCFMLVYLLNAIKVIIYEFKMYIIIIYTDNTYKKGHNPNFIFS